MGARGGGGRPPAAQPSASSPRSPVPRIKWRKVDGSLSPQWATAEPTLQIPGVGFEDEGTYECEAENAKGRDTVQGRLIVQGRVRPRPERREAARPGLEPPAQSALGTGRKRLVQRPARPELRSARSPPQ